MDLMVVSDRRCGCASVVAVVEMVVVVVVVVEEPAAVGHRVYIK
jgi:hypothetical protein